MINNSAYLNNSLQAITDKSRDLLVTSCGHYRLLTKTCLPTNRPKGRPDYQILYVANGKGIFYFNGKRTTVSAGHLVIYYPRETQRYYYYLKDSPEVYWVHFTGKDAKKILQTHNIKWGQHTIRIGTNHEIVQIYKRMHQELLLDKVNSEEMLSCLLRQLLILSMRSTLLIGKEKKSEIYTIIDDSIEFLNVHYSENINIEEHAKSLGIATCWYIRKFRESVGTTPMQYIIDTRLKNAELLLINTDYSVSEISELVGYHNPLYFSRHFKQKKGMSPRDYRRKVQ